MSGHVAVDVRCPTNPTQLFARLRLGPDGQPVAYEVACRDCRRKEGVGLVLHVYDLDGEFLTTERA